MMMIKCFELTKLNVKLMHCAIYTYTHTHAQEVHLHCVTQTHQTHQTHHTCQSTPKTTTTTNRQPRGALINLSDVSLHLSSLGFSHLQVELSQVDREMKRVAMGGRLLYLSLRWQQRFLAPLCSLLYAYQHRVVSSTMLMRATPCLFRRQVTQGVCNAADSLRHLCVRLPVKPTLNF